MAYELLRELRRQGDLVEGDTVLVEVHPRSPRCWQSTDRAFLEEMEKRLQKRIIVKARGSFHVEDFEIRSPNEKAPIEKSEVASGSRDDKDGPRDGKRRKRRKRHLGSPAEVEAVLEEDEAASVVDPEFLAGAEAERNGHGHGRRPLLPATPPPGDAPPGRLARSQGCISEGAGNGGQTPHPRPLPGRPGPGQTASGPRASRPD